MSTQFDVIHPRLEIRRRASLATRTTHVPLEILHEINNIRMRDKVDISRVFPLQGIGKCPNELEKRLNEYLQRSLTIEAVTLNAFEGVLTAFEHKLSVRNLCGILIFPPEIKKTHLDPFVLGLTWSADEFRRGLPRAKATIEFPSWTWLRWKVAKVHFHKNWFPRSNDATCHRAIAHASIEYADELVLSWREESGLLLAQEKSGITPHILRMKGPMFDVQTSPEGSFVGEDEGGIVEQINLYYGKPGKILHRRIQGAYQLKEADNGLLNLILLVSLQWYDEIDILVLYKTEGSSCFERIGRLDFWMRCGDSL